MKSLSLILSTCSLLALSVFVLVWPQQIAAALNAASDGTLPWNSHNTQEVVGPTAAWTDMSTHKLFVCNGKWCWKYDLTSSQWENNGNPIDLTTDFGQGMTPKDGSVIPITAWEEYKNALVSLSKKNYLWLKNMADGSWFNGGTAISLSELAPWSVTVASSDGTQLFSKDGLTAAWTDKINSREFFCNGHWCWSYSYEESRWQNQDDQSRGRPFSVTEVFKVAPAPDGSTLTSHGGPQVAWTDDVKNVTTICNDGWCWTYTQKKDTNTNLLDDPALVFAWDDKNAAGLGQPYRFCEKFGTSASCGGAAQQAGDLNGDGHVTIFDYNSLLEKFGLTGAAAFHPADINKNGIVDIFDYNQLLANFGK
ncbi:dockerin type I repeat-containing protein [Candidatus Woesebacteria bacterium]|nr:dockerin type I repeat-containing protein [Candidatus Woesebacteria bacterium]